jgi:carboxylesterase
MGETMTRAPLGGLILHGFTSSLDCVSPLAPIVERHGLPYRMPVLRGHGTRPEDLSGVSWQDWYADARAALQEVRGEADRVIVLGLSMGALLTLHLASEHPEDVAGIVCIATVLRVDDPLAPGGWLSFLRPLVVRLKKTWPMPPNYADKDLERFDTNYAFAPSDAANSVVEYGPFVEQRLDKVVAPALILHARRDPTAAPAGAQVVHDHIRSSQKDLIWFDRTYHEMLRDCQADEVAEAAERFVAGLVSSEA